jgi:periplasmic copper chaperone A
MRRLILAAIVLAIPAHGVAEGNGIKLDNAWSRAAAAGRIGVVYLTITDTGAPDRLTAVASPVSASAGLHESYDDHRVAKMRNVIALPLEPGRPVSLVPGGFHIMLTGLKQPLHQGDEFPVTLMFDKAGAVTTTVTVRKAGASMPMGHDAMGGMQMRDMPMQSGQRQ